jgi:hypothetical protein
MGTIVVCTITNIFIFKPLALRDACLYRIFETPLKTIASFLFNPKIFRQGFYETSHVDRNMSLSYGSIYDIPEANNRKK